MHIHQTAVHILDAFVLLDMLAEGTVAQLHIRELILVLDEELAAILAHVDCHVRNDVLEVPLRVARVKVRVVHDVNFLEAEALKSKLVHLDRLVFSLMLSV